MLNHNQQNPDSHSSIMLSPKVAISTTLAPALHETLSTASTPANMARHDITNTIRNRCETSEYHQYDTQAV
jgi:hypothetical protein